MFGEKVGIILQYFDEDYEHYKNLRGDYSDVQVCVDIKFDGVTYQGEFAHEHINPMYIERMTLHEKDDRMAYLNYLINRCNKRNPMLESDKKPEYAGGAGDTLEQKYLGSYLPVQDAVSDIWCVQTEHGFECGDVAYVAAEFSGTGLIYHFTCNGEIDHVHDFESVLAEVLRDPEQVDIVTDDGEYSEQEIQMVKGIKRAAAFVHSHHRFMTNAELRENSRREVNPLSDDMISAVLYLKPICDDDIVTDFVWISSKRQMHKLLEQYKHDDFRTVPELILLKMCYTESGIR